MAKKELKVKEVPRSELQGEKSWWGQSANLGLVLVLALLTVGAIYAATRLLGPADEVADTLRAEEQAATSASACRTDAAALTGALPEPTSRLPDGSAQWASPFPLLIDSSKDYRATILTSKGAVEVDLYEKQTPETVNNFVALAASGFYNGLPFHRVIDGFVAQGGDPTGTGRGGPGYQFPDELVAELRHDRPGLLSMANSGANTNGSQFFITYAPAPHLDGFEATGEPKACGQLGPNGFPISCHSIFGIVTEGLENAQALSRVDPSQPGALEPDSIQCVSISVR